jgi:hypothetical protein
MCGLVLIRAYVMKTNADALIAETIGNYYYYYYYCMNINNRINEF